MVHFYRKVFCHVPATKVREVSHMLKAIHVQESREAADRKARVSLDDGETVHNAFFDRGFREDQT